MRNFYFSTVGFANVNFWRLRRKMKAIDETTIRREKLGSEEIFALIDCVGKIEISRKINRSGKPLRDVVVVTANINLLNELQDVRNLSLIHRN